DCLMTTRIDWLRGCGTALVTPFAATGDVDEPRFRALVERQIASGVPLLVPCGTTGEAATLDPQEQRRLIALTVEVARGRARVIAGVGSNATAVTRAFGRRRRDVAAHRVGRRWCGVGRVERCARLDGAPHRARAPRRVGGRASTPLPLAASDGSELHRVEPGAREGRAGGAGA